MPSGDDEVDQRRARSLAWKTFQPGEPVVLDEPEAEEAQPSLPTLEERAIWRARAAQVCADLAAEVERAWALPPGKRRAAAAVGVARFAVGAGFDIFGMASYPLASVRLARLVVRHFDSLPANEHMGLMSALGHLEFAGAEGTELMCEVAASGEDALVFAISIATPDEGLAELFPGLGARLAALLDSNPRWETRAVVASWLSDPTLDEGVPALRRALRAPHLGVRAAALGALVKRTPPAVTAEDVLFLIDDAVRHPLPDIRHLDESAMLYERALLSAVAALRPPAGERPLAAIAGGDCAFIGSRREWLGERWALETLAAGYPQAALARIDAGLRSANVWDRRRAIEAAARLPEAEASARLLAGAADPSTHVRELARDRWMDLHAAPCPVDALAGAQLELLEGPPSAEFRARLGVLASDSEEAQAAMALAILALPPDREALVLLLFALADSNFVIGKPLRRSLPKDQRAWGRRLCKRFGDVAIEGLCALAERYPTGTGDWLSVLREMAGKHELGAGMGRAREMARRLVLSRPEDRRCENSSALGLLRDTGGLPPELVDRAWELAFGDEDVYARSPALDLLADFPAHPELDARIAGALSVALEQGDPERFESVCDLGIRRGLPAAFDAARRVLGEMRESAWTDARASCARSLFAAGQLGEDWTLAALAEPGGPLFAIAARALGPREDVSPRVAKALARSLDSEEATPESRLAAARALVWLERTRAGDTRLRAVLDAAPLAGRVELAYDLLVRGAPFRPLRRHFVAALSAGADPKAARSAVEALWTCKPKGADKLFALAYQNVSDPELRAVLADDLEIASEADLYWQDQP